MEIDRGTGSGADSQPQAQLRMMGRAVGRVVSNKTRPTVGLLNIGVEEVKGGEEIRKASEQLRAMNLPEFEYIGFVEGDGIGGGGAGWLVSGGVRGAITLEAGRRTPR